MKLRSVLPLALVATVLAPSQAQAVEQEWHLGGAANYGLMTFARAPSRNGFGGQLLARYGLNDALDLSLSAAAMSFLEDGRLVFSGAAGVAYVVDVLRWIPTVGAHIGVVDIVTTRCETLPELCYHDIRPTVGVPISLEYRVLPELPVGARFEPTLLLFGEPSWLLTTSLYGAVAF